MQLRIVDDIVQTMVRGRELLLFLLANLEGQALLREHGVVWTEELFHCEHYQ